MKYILAIFISFFLFSCSQPIVPVTRVVSENPVVIKIPEVQNPLTVYAYNCTRDTTGYVSSDVIVRNPNESQYILTFDILFTAKSGVKKFVENINVTIEPRSQEEKTGPQRITVSTPFEEFKNIKSCKVTRFEAVQVR